MGNLENLIDPILVIFIIAIGIAVLMGRSRTKKRAAYLSKKVFSAWAVQGPFHPGADSAEAIRKAKMNVLGHDSMMRNADTIEQHAVVFDNDPEGWEVVRQRYIA